MKPLKALDSTPIGRFLILFTLGLAYYLLFRFLGWLVDPLANWAFSLELHPVPWYEPRALGPAILFVALAFSQLLRRKD